MNYNAIMRIPRFYCPDISSDVLEIHDQKIIHHLIKVLRARQGQSVVLFDGNGKTLECEIKEIEKKINAKYTYQTLAPYGVIKDLTLEGSVLVVAMVEIACRLLLIYLLKMTYYQQAVKN